MLLISEEAATGDVPPLLDAISISILNINGVAMVTLGGPGKNKMKIIHETDNGVINNHISNHEISQRSTDQRRRQFRALKYCSLPAVSEAVYVPNVDGSSSIDSCRNT